MPSTYTNNTGIEKPGSGEQSGTWGTTTNTNFDIIDQAVHGQASLTIVSDTDLTTNDGSTSDGANTVILLTGSPGAAFELRITPTDQEKHYTIKNDTDSTCTVVYKGVTASVGTNAVSIPTGKAKSVAGDGGGASGIVTELLTTDINTDLVNDTSPQLGGDLDANSNNILMGNQSVKFGTSKWEIVLDTGDNDLLFKYNGTTVFKLASNGAVTSANNITAYGSP